MLAAVRHIKQVRYSVAIIIGTGREEQADASVPSPQHRRGGGARHVQQGAETSSDGQRGAGSAHPANLPAQIFASLTGWSQTKHVLIRSTLALLQDLHVNPGSNQAGPGGDRSASPVNRR